MQKYVIALYIRLSIEDYKYESMSIENQRLVLNAHAASMPEYANAEILDSVFGFFRIILVLVFGISGVKIW